MRLRHTLASFLFPRRDPYLPFVASCFSNMLSSSAPAPAELEKTFSRLRSDPREVFLLDGGTGEELFRRNVPDDRKIWSATALVHPQYHDTLEAVHCSFLKNGSRAVTTNSYGVVPGVGFEETEITKYMDLAGQIARRAVKKHESSDTVTNPCFVFGSLGPLVESYRADLILPHEEGVKCYRRACQALLPYADAMLGETMSCIKESLQVLDGVAEVAEEKKQQLSILISYTLDSNGNFRDGQVVTQGIQQILEQAKTKNNVKLLGILFNCCEPEALTIALEKINSDKDLVNILSDSDVLLGAYANRLTQVDPNWSLAESESPQPFRKDLNERHYWEDFVQQWIDKYGVKMIGGCCGITPEHISYIQRELDKKMEG